MKKSIFSLILTVMAVSMLAMPAVQAETSLVFVGVQAHYDSPDVFTVNTVAAYSETNSQEAGGSSVRFKQILSCANPAHDHAATSAASLLAAIHWDLGGDSFGIIRH